MTTKLANQNASSNDSSYDFATKYTLNLKSGVRYYGPFMLPPAFEPIDPSTQPVANYSLYIPNIIPAAKGGSNFPGPPPDTFSFSVLNSGPIPIIKIDIPATDVLSPETGRGTFEIPASLYDALFDKFIQFRTYLDELQTQNLLYPHGARTTAARIASNIPLRYDQLLRFQYLLDVKNRWLDLSPGMRLRSIQAPTPTSTLRLAPVTEMRMSAPVKPPSSFVMARIISCT